MGAQSPLCCDEGLGHELWCPHPSLSAQGLLGQQPLRLLQTRQGAGAAHDDLLTGLGGGVWGWEGSLATS